MYSGYLYTYSTEVQRVSFVDYTGGEGGSLVCGTYKIYTLCLGSVLGWLDTGNIFKPPQAFGLSCVATCSIANCYRHIIS